jgi:hypothetical protein
MNDFQVGFLIGVCVVFGGAIIAIVKGKSGGWGPLSTSTLLLTLVLFAATIALILTKMDFSQFSNLLFAIAGFAGALLTREREKKSSTGKTARPTR